MAPSCYDVRAACRIITMRRQVQLPKTAILKKLLTNPTTIHTLGVSLLSLCVS